MPVLIIRAGEGTEKYLDAYDSQTIGTMEDDEFVTFEGNAKDSVLGEHYEITSERLKAAIRVANEMTGRPVRFLRLGDDDPHWLQQVSGIDGKGKITMAKHHGLHANPRDARDANGNIDEAKAAAGMEAAKASYTSGKIKLLTMHEETTDDGFVIFTSVGKLTGKQ